MNAIYMDSNPNELSLRTGWLNEGLSTIKGTMQEIAFA